MNAPDDLLPGFTESFFMGGFECSTHRRHPDGTRLDMVAATSHDRFALEDYRRLRNFGLRTARDGLRCVSIEGVCWYPIVNHPGWDDERHCHNGLWDDANAAGAREMHEPLAREMRHQMRAAEQFSNDVADREMSLLAQPALNGPSLG